MKTRTKKLKKVLAILSKPPKARKINLLVKRPVELNITREISDKRTLYLLEKMREVKKEVRMEFSALVKNLEEKVLNKEELTSTLSEKEKEIRKELEKLDVRGAEKETEVNAKLEELRIDMLRLHEISTNRGGGMNRQINVGGNVMSDRYTDINLVAGSGVTISTADDNMEKNVDVTISAQVSGGILAATGTIDDSNVDFTFASLPSVLIINGATYQQTGGAITWSWTAGTLTATLSSPVGSGGSIFGLS